MRYNQFQTDPLSNNDAAHAEASRYDLRYPSVGTAKTYGAIDAKISSFIRVRENLQANGADSFSGLVSAQSGPTHDDQSPFQWSNTTWDTTQIHLGQPNVWNFSFVNISISAPLVQM